MKKYISKFKETEQNHHRLLRPLTQCFACLILSPQEPQKSTQLFYRGEDWASERLSNLSKIPELILWANNLETGWEFSLISPQSLLYARCSQSLDRRGVLSMSVPTTTQYLYHNSYDRVTWNWMLHLHSCRWQQQECLFWDLWISQKDLSFQTLSDTTVPPVMLSGNGRWGC